MMATWQFAFPVTRTCLWDTTPCGRGTELSIGWLFIQISSSAIQLAFDHAKNSCSKTMDCFMLGTSWINNVNGVSLEIDRFDPGRPNKERTDITPTALIAGDVPVKTQVVVGVHPDSKYIPYNLNSLQDTLTDLRGQLSHGPISNLDPTHFFSFRLHFSSSPEGVVTIQCGCILPSLIYQATPIQSIPIVSTALARNLAGPLPLSSVQGKVKHGYITMESSRKLVLLLHSDPIVLSLPLIGVWISGVNTINDPLVWTACVVYSNSSALTDRVYGEGGNTFVILIYSEGCSQPILWECSIKRGLGGDDTPLFDISNGEATMQLSSEHTTVGFDLNPAVESTALHTLLQTTQAIPPANVSDKLPGCATAAAADTSFDSPQPLPLPTPSHAPEVVARDKNLSVISAVSNHHCSSISHSDDDGDCSIKPFSPGPCDEPATVDKVNNRSPTTSTGTINLEQQVQLLTEQVQYLLKAQSPSVSSSVSSTVSITTTAPTTTATTTITTNDAATSTGKSLYLPAERSFYSPASRSSGNEETIISDDFSMCTDSISASSQYTSVHLDFHNYVSSSTDHLQSYQGSGSVSDTCHKKLQDRSPSSQHQDEELMTSEEIIEYALKKLTSKRWSSLENNDHASSEHMGTGEGGSLSSGSIISQHEVATSSDPQVKSEGSLNGSDSSHDDKTPTPPHSARGQRRKEQVLHENMDKTPTPPHSARGQRKEEWTLQENKEIHQTNYSSESRVRLPPHSQPTFTSASQYYLHPEVLHQHYSQRDISMLPVPHIVCPNNATGDAVLFKTDSDYTMDENVYLADLIAQKYLGIYAHQSNNGNMSVADDEGTDQNSPNISMATHQYLQRHNLLQPTQRTASPLQEKQRTASPLQEKQRTASPLQEKQRTASPLQEKQRTTSPLYQEKDSII